MRISIFGLGYVGVVAAGCMAADGHTVIGVDPSKTKVDLINKGVPPIVEKDIGEIVAAAAATGQLSATEDARKAVMETDISLICVGANRDSPAAPPVPAQPLEIAHTMHNTPAKNIFAAWEWERWRGGRFISGVRVALILKRVTVSENRMLNIP